MRQQLSKIILFIFICLVQIHITYASSANSDESVTIDRIQLVNEQIHLLKNRLMQSQQELNDLQQQHHTNLSQFSIENTNKNLLDKASLDISVSQSNLDSINIELTDTRQTITWLEKNIQEIENQLNVLNIFGAKVETADNVNVQELQGDVNYQRKLLALEKIRLNFLQSLQSAANGVLQFKRENYNHINTLLKSQKMLHIKQQQVQDELAFQQQQNYWLHQVTRLYAAISKVDPLSAKETYSNLERSIFYANENANFSYFQSLLARYKDQIQQMKLTVLKSDSINLLSETSNQSILLVKQINNLDAVVRSRAKIVARHIGYMEKKEDNNPSVKNYVHHLKSLEIAYESATYSLEKLNASLIELRKTLDQALQNELSSRQGFPMFGMKTFLDLGREMLLIPTLTFQVLKSLSNNLLKTFQHMTPFSWSVFAMTEVAFLFSTLLIFKLLTQLLERPSQWRNKINLRWLSLQYLRRSFIDLILIGNAGGILFAFNVPFSNFAFLAYLAGVWLLCKAILVLSHICLMEMETTHNHGSHDVHLYRVLKYLSLIGGFIIAFTVFVHQLPMIYEVKTLCDRLLLLLLMGFSLLLLRLWDVFPNLILSQMETQHPYLEGSIRLIGILIPLIMFSNALIGLAGFVNLVMTVSWYEGVFLIVLMGYLLLRGLLSDGLEEVSRLMIQYSSNGWLWTEAFLKPLHRVLKITLFLTAWAVLFLLYGWDKQSPIVERLTRLLHYQLINVLNTTIMPISIIELCIVISIFYWVAKWMREFMYRLLLSRTKDMGIRNSIAIISQYTVSLLGVFICLRVLGIDFRALLAVAGMFAFGVGLGLRDLANNFACGFLILLERPLRVGDIVCLSNIEGEVTHIGSRAVTVRTWDCLELVVPNTEVFNKSFTNWTARDNTVRTIVPIKISRHDNPHEVKLLIHDVLASHKDILKNPAPEVFLREINDSVMDFEVRYFVNIRQVESRVSVTSSILMTVWDVFAENNIRPPYPHHEIFVRDDTHIVKPSLSELPIRNSLEKLSS